MDYEFEKQWKDLTDRLSDEFGMPVDLQGVLFLIGVQELGHGFQKYKKDEKVQLMHIAICRLLMPFGYYELEATDQDGWPHYKELKKLPALEPAEQQQLIRRAVVEYFTES